MPVVRGWSATHLGARTAGERRRSPGGCNPDEGSGHEDPDPNDDVLPEVRIASIGRTSTPTSTAPYVVARDVRAPGLAQVQPETIPAVSGTTALRNLLYAFQWWIFGGFAVFVWTRWCRDSLSELRAESVPSGA